MTREETKKLLHIMQAFAEGKTIEYMGISINSFWQSYWNPKGLKIRNINVTHLI